MIKSNTIKVSSLAMIAVLGLGTLACKKKGCTDPYASNYNAEAQKDDGSCIESTTTENVVKTGTITVDETWTANTIYELNGKVVVDNGATLTIEPGTIIKGQQGTGANASALVVARGSKIHAVGTASMPIIFTSVLDNIQIGELVGTNLDENDKGKWGGVIILGNSEISAGDGDVLSQIEGIPVTDTYGAFGGSDVNDNSGELSYISIRHGGALIGAGNEINGLTLGGVGAGTTISNIEVVANVDDGIECFGGSVDLSNVIVGYVGDDAIDIDFSYAGEFLNFVVVTDANSDEGLEIDGPEGSSNLDGMFTLTNGSVYGMGGATANADLKSKAQGTITNVSFGTAKIRASYTNNCMDPKADAFTYLTDASPRLSVTGSTFTAVSVYTNSDDGAATPTDCTVFPQDQTAAETAMTSGSSTGADDSVFNAWTWMSIKNKM